MRSAISRARCRCSCRDPILITTLCIRWLAPKKSSLRHFFSVCPRINCACLNLAIGILGIPQAMTHFMAEIRATINGPSSWTALPDLGWKRFSPRLYLRATVCWCLFSALRSGALETTLRQFGFGAAPGKAVDATLTVYETAHSSDGRSKLRYALPRRLPLSLQCVLFLLSLRAHHNCFLVNVESKPLRRNPCSPSMPHRQVSNYTNAMDTT